MIPSSKQPTARNAPSLGERAVLVYRERFWQDFAAWALLILVTVIGLCALGWAYWTGTGVTNPIAALFGRHRGAPEAEQSALPVAPIQPERRRLLDGQPLVGDAPDCGYYAVMIDNLEPARPQSGLAAASLVISAPVEAGITRFLAFYPTDTLVKKIGPVRSARPYYLDWARELDALYVHVGGSPEALTKLKTSDLRDLNQFYFGQQFWRDSAREMPHNTYTSSELMNKYISEKLRCVCRECRAPSFKELADAEERPTEVADLAISHRTKSFAVTWKYDWKKNEYRRWQGGKQQIDADGAAITAVNVAVMFTDVVVLDDIGRRRVTTIGTGKALIAQDGQVIEGTWRKTKVSDRTRFFDADGQEIAFNVGHTWIEVEPEGTKVEW